MIKLAIFDLDGTLINSIEDLADGVNLALEKYGYPTHEYSEYNYFVGDGVRKMIYRALPCDERTEENYIKINNEFSAYYRENFSKKTKIYDGMEKLLYKLKGIGIRLAVASNKPDEFTKAIISGIFEKNTFDFVSGNIEGVARKPEPDIVNSILASADVTVEEAVMIGDTNIDIFTGMNAGIRTIGCLWGFRDRAELEKAGADVIVEEPLEIYDALKKM